MNKNPIQWAGKAKGILKRKLAETQSGIWRKKPEVEADFFNASNFAASLRSPGLFYRKAHNFYFYRLDQGLRKHREYFCHSKRGFGEDAFHVMWWMLFREFRPASFLEIGVYRGQVLSLASLLQRDLGIPGAVTGISPFLPAGDTVSVYLQDVDYLQDTLGNFCHFSLPEPELVRAFSTDSLAVERIRSQSWDAIYIDGNHDYDVARQDWDHCSASLKKGGIIVLDDSGLGTAYRPPLFATAGHPGPSRLAGEIDPVRFKEILQVGHNRVFQKIA